MRLNKEMRKVCRQMVKASFTNGRLDASKVKGAVNYVIETKPRYYIDILKQYQRLIRLEAEKTHAVIESAAPLASDVSAKITSDLRAKHGADISTEFKTSPDLLGGLRIRIGSDVWDGSVRHRLDRLAQQFNEI